MDISYNTLALNLEGKHHPKVDVLLKVSDGLFPESRDQFFPDVPKDIAKSLTYNEMMARVFSEWLERDSERIKQVADLMCKIADEKLTPLSVLDNYLKEKERKEEEVRNEKKEKKRKKNK